MSISPLISNIPGSSSSTPSTGIAKDFNRFLQLLTTQLKHQDPLSPLDTNQFTNQLVQFSQVEQSIGMNQNLAKLVSAQEASQQRADVTTGQSFIGKSVDALGESVALENGEAELFYAADAGAASVEIELLDGLGNVVAALPGQATTGLQRIVWDGTDLNGHRMDDGIYRLRAIARDADAAPVATQTGFTATVTGLRNENGQVQLVAGAISVPVGSVVAVRNPLETN